MKNTIKILLLIFSFIVAFAGDLMAMGAPGPPNGGGPPGGCWPPSSCIPIDGGLSFLLIAGVAYGGKKIYDISKDKEKAE